MQEVSVEEAKTRLDDLIQSAVNGEEVVITIGNQKIVKLVGKAQSLLGLMKAESELCCDLFHRMLARLIVCFIHSPCQFDADTVGQGAAILIVVDSCLEIRLFLRHFFLILLRLSETCRALRS